jgi:hypothetical protein
MSGGCAAGENDRREALRFPALRVRDRVSGDSNLRREAPVNPVTCHPTPDPRYHGIV